MRHSLFKCKAIFEKSGMAKCSCGQTFHYKSARDWDMKIRMHKKFCDK